ncbi:MAG: strawberry notch family protein [Planctomycetes bacterium]|nr:strawberry notch family protein [Planctomycetota bacterium]MBI3833482.1 strawberry notch family protein [Planctomycetota bacterium]
MNRTERDKIDYPLGLPCPDDVRPSSTSARDMPQLQFDFKSMVMPALTSANLAEDRPELIFAIRFATLLGADPDARFDNPSLAQLAHEIFGNSAGHARDIYDAAEAGFNIYLNQINLDVSDVPGVLDRLLAEQARLPTQNRRDQEQIDFQQFSTPPAEAFLVVKAAAIRPRMTVLEPSAGTGNIAVLARLAGGELDTNEIDERRLRLLLLQQFAPTAFDAERLDNLLCPGKFYDVIVMNPPFSATGGRVKGHSSYFGARHLEQALLRLKRGGRLVAIVGRGMALDRFMFRDWWTGIETRYRVRANIGMNGNVYAKFGTTFEHQLIVIDHDGATENEADIIVGSELSIHEAYEVLKHLSQEDVYGRIRENHQAASCVCAADPVFPGSPQRNRSVTRIDGGASPRWGRGRLLTVPNYDDNGAMAHLEPPRAPVPCSDHQDHHPGSGTGTNSAPARLGSHALLGRATSPSHARPSGDGVGEIESSASSQAISIEEGTVYAAYRVQKAIVRGANLHPANVVESTAMASVEPPDVTYRHHLPPEIIAEGWISNLQLEDVIYAGQATSSSLPDGARKGHWNGDGTGIGKGREIYAFIYNELEQGRTKHVHISASHQLHADATRDRDAVGLPLPIVHQARFKPTDTIPAEAGVFFTTYTMLSTDFDGGQPRFKQLVGWLGPDFEGVIAFDEAHLMKNAAATPHGSKATVDEGTLRGNMGIALQRMFPQARVRYFSATGATEARHMAPYERLGLWGVGAPFPDFSSFLLAMERGGVAAMEMLCRDLKSVGMYLSRTISYGATRLCDGTIVPDSAVEYEPLLHRLIENERRQYNDIADLWSELLVAFESAEQNACQKRNAHRYAQFYSAQQRFFLQLMMAYTLPDVIPEIEKDLTQGRSVILSLFNTGEAQTDRKVRDARANGIELSELDATPREMIVQLIEKQFPIYQYREVTDPRTGNVISVRVEDAAGNPEFNRENQRRQQEILDKVADLDFPQNPLDSLISHFGVGSVAEISGRTHRFEHGKYVRRKIHGVSRRELNEYETRLFQQGKKRLAVISGAGSTGISVHADVDAKNQQRRVFYAFQLSWSADQQMQAFGRVHRSNQTSAPVIRLVLLDLAGQKRLVNAVSKRLAALGALTKGERHSLSSDLFRPEDVTDNYGKAALAKLYRQIESNAHKDDGIGFRDLERMGVLNKEKTAVRDNYASNVEQFLNRIMVLHVEKQNRIFELFYESYVQAVEAAKQNGAFDFGVEEIRAINLRKIAEPQILFVDPASGARTILYELEGEVDVIRHAFDNVAAGQGFYRNRRSERIYAVSDHWDANRSEVFLTGVKGPRRALERHELTEKYNCVDREDARSWWEAVYANTPATEPKRFYILSGAIFPIYDKVMGSEGIQNVKIARAVLADGQALVGLNLSSTDVPNVKQRLGIGTPLGESTPAEILALITGGSVIELDNGWQLMTRRIAGDDVVELSLNGVPANREELRAYGLCEEIVSYKRHWFVVLEDAAAVLPEVLAHRKPVRDLTATQASESPNLNHDGSAAAINDEEDEAATTLR